MILSGFDLSMSGKKTSQENEIKYVDIRPLKELVSKELPPLSIARRIILEENDSITVTSFLEKLKVWMKIVKEERQEIS